MGLIGRTWTVECQWCDDGDYIDPRGHRHRCAHCDRTNKVEVVPADQLRGAVEALEQIALLLEALPHGPLTTNERECLERAQMLALPFTAGGQ